MLKKVLGLALLSFFLFSLPASALYVKTGDNIVVSKGTIINDNLFAAGEKIIVSGVVKGDVIAFGGEITIDGRVDGNVVTAGGDIIVGGSARNVFAAGGDISISGIVKNDLLAGGGQLYIDKDVRIGKDAFIGCGQAKIAGKIFRDLRIGCADMMIMPSAIIKGKLDYSAESFNISDKAKVVGTITSYARPEYGRQAARFFSGVALTGMIVSFLAVFVLGILAIVFYPNQVKLITSEMLSKFWRSLGWGILSLIVIPILAILLFITLIGIPLGILLSIAYLFGIYIAGIFTSVIIGKAIFDRIGKKEINLIWALLVGLIILKLIGFIPLVGWLIKFVLFLWAFGALVATRFTTYNMAREKGVV